MKKTFAIAAVATLALSAAAHAQRDQIRVVGSSTVYPFTTKVAEQFGKTSKFKTPVVESTGTGGGFKLFCAGVGPKHPDVTNASRAIKQSERDQCTANGVKEITEVKVGFDGIVLANAKNAPAFKLSRRQVYLALAKNIPGSDGKMTPNPYKNWNQIDKSLPNEKIEVLGPPPTSGTRDAFVELVMEAGCSTFPALKAAKKDDEDWFKQACDTIREDGAYIAAGENDNLIVQKLVSNPNAVGIFGYSFLEENEDKIKGALVDSVVPTFENIASLKYPVSRPLFVYVKNAHVGVIPGIAEFVSEYTSDKAMGQDGYLADIGLIPLPNGELAKVRTAAAKITGKAAPAKAASKGGAK
ncbi:MAG TPA: PstS family phosphate ABC transporter substrate-binding protein [Thermoanaerobaculia bacterium]|nr:PstS family phosphate ABC transporter substrate-binding protein [Thermoanaerobaculia bacterium]